MYLCSYLLYSLLFGQVALLIFSVLFQFICAVKWAWIWFNSMFHWLWTGIVICFEQFFLLIAKKNPAPPLFFFDIHILWYYPALNHCPCTLSCILHYWISFFSLVTSFVAKGQDSVFELWGSSVIIDPAEVTRIVNIVMRPIPGRILFLLLG